MTPDRDIKPEWNQPNRRITSGLFLLWMSAQQDWIVRRDLSIDLTSATYARQHYEVDVNMEEVERRIPPMLGRSDDRLIWLPVMRLPSVRSEEQRVTEATLGRDRTVPIMPQSEVRRRVADGLTWLILNRLHHLRDEASSDRARIRNGITQAIRAYLTTGEHGLRASNDLGRYLAPEDWRWLRDLFEPSAAADWTNYSAGLAECIEYARYGYLAVVGIDRDDRYPRVRLDLLPAELEHRRYAGGLTARQFLGFEAVPDGTDLRGALVRPWRWPRIVLAQLFAPSSNRLRIPVPEVADLDSVHIELTTSEDVCISPAVLQHDRRTTVADVGSVIQSRVRGGEVARSPLAVIADHLGADPAPLTEDAIDQLADDLRDVAETWRRRQARLARADALIAPTATLPRRLQRLARQVRNFRAADPEPTTDLYRTATRLATGIDQLATDLAQVRPADASDRLSALAETEASIPQLEITGDDDLRDHVAHFYVDSTETALRRSTDSRPAVKAVVRVSEQGRSGYVLTATIACLISTGLLSGLWLLLATVTGGGYDPEALVAVLLLVPAISVALVGRVDGGTMRHLVLGRAQRLTYLSLVAPVLSAGIVAALFGFSDDETLRPAVPLGPFGPVTVEELLGALALVSLIPTGLVSLAYLRHKRRFRWGAPIVGLLAHRGEIDQTATIRGDHDETAAATVDRDRIVRLTQPALFQINRPHQRFMVVITIDHEFPNAFRQALETLERLPELLQARRPALWQRLVPRRPGDRSAGSAPDPAEMPAIVESSLVTSVATTGTVMSIVSHNLGQGVDQILPEMIEQIVTERLDDDGRSPDVLVEEIVDDTQYFQYRPLGHVDYTLTGVDRKEARQGLLRDLLGLETEHRRIAYVYGPIRPRPRRRGHGAPIETEVDGGAVRVGFACFLDGPVTDSLPLRLAEVARANGYRVAKGREVGDEPGAGAAYEWAEHHEPDSGLRPHMLVAAGPNDEANGLDRALRIVEQTGAELEGGTMLTNGGYTCASLRVWGDEPTMEALAEAVGSGPTGKTTNRGTGWRLRPSQTSDRFVEDDPDLESTPAGRPDGSGAATTGEPDWLVVWIRWRLDARSGGLRRLLDALEVWKAETVGDWRVRYTTIEFLVSELKGRVVTGKARYRVAVDCRPPTSGGPQRAADVADDVRRSLEVALHVAVADHLDRNDRYVTVEPNEPGDPRRLLPDRAGPRSRRPGPQLR